MKNYVELERLGYVLPQDLTIGLILNGLTSDFAGFVRNYNMHNMGKTVGELHAMLIEYEKGLPKKAETPQVMMIKGVYIPKPKNPKPSAKEHPAKDDTCHHCKEVGHCKRNCTAYLAELIKKKKQVGTASSSDVFIIELFSFPTKSWVYDTSCDNYHYTPSITRGVISVHRLVENRFVQCFTNFRISVSKNNVFYFNVIPSNGIYEIDMHDLVPNVNSIYNVSTKRAKHNLDSTYLWHCRLAHISKKRIEKLQQEGLLKSTDDESFDQCVSCLSGKMTRKSFPHRPERATDLLGIIHTDVCGPLRHVSRQGASYFITFTDDYSRYGYVYLLKHKHEVFETFKVFKNEVENQLGKTIKALRSDRGGEYISQEFKDYLKACGIVQQLTPPYTPQHNGSLQHAFSIWFKPRRLIRLHMNYGYPKETMGYYFYFSPENKIVVARYAEFFEKNLITQEVSGRAMDLKEIQDEDTSPSEITSNIPQEVEGFEPPQPPQEEVIPVRRSERTHRAPDRLCLNVEAEEHSLGDLNEPTSYKAVMLDSESNKWIDAMNAKIQSIMDNMLWVLVDLPHRCKTAGTKGYTQLYGVDYEETFSPVADIRAIRILISIAAFYDYEICWNKRFDEEIKRSGFDQNLDESCVYQKASGSNVTFLILDRSKRLIELGQNVYMDKILKRYKMDNSKRGHIPMQERLDLNKTQGASTPKEVKRIRFQQNPGESYWTDVKNILKYLRNTKDMFLVYGGNLKAKLRVNCYCNAGFETDIDDMKSLTGYFFVLNRIAVE
ncbi:retrotransposon protein, putative, ty1-copia subclass [Tanacetum coccineum]